MKNKSETKIIKSKQRITDFRYSSVLIRILRFLGVFLPPPSSLANAFQRMQRIAQRPISLQYAVQQLAQATKFQLDICQNSINYVFLDITIDYLCYLNTFMPHPAIAVNKRGPKSRAGFSAAPQLY